MELLPEAAELPSEPPWCAVEADAGAVPEHVASGLGTANAAPDVGAEAMGAEKAQEDMLVTQKLIGPEVHISL